MACECGNDRMETRKHSDGTSTLYCPVCKDEPVFPTRGGEKFGKSNMRYCASIVRTDETATAMFGGNSAKLEEAARRNSLKGDRMLIYQLHKEVEKK